MAAHTYRVVVLATKVHSIYIMFAPAKIWKVTWLYVFVSWYGYLWLCALIFGSCSFQIVLLDSIVCPSEHGEWYIFLYWTILCLNWIIDSGFSIAWSILPFHFNETACKICPNPFCTSNYFLSIIINISAIFWLFSKGKCGLISVVFSNTFSRSWPKGNLIWPIFCNLDEK